MKNHKIELKKLEDVDEVRFYKIDELSDLLKVSKRTLRRYCEEDIFENAVKMGNKDWIVPGCDVLKLCGYEAKDTISDSSCLEKAGREDRK